MAETFDPTDLKCAMPVVRAVYNDIDDTTEPHIDTCGEPLRLITTELRYLCVGGVIDGDGPHWRVECDAGHVVLIPDNDDDRNVPFRFDDIVPLALDHIVNLVRPRRWILGMDQTVVDL